MRLKRKFTFKWDLPGQYFPHYDCIAANTKKRGEAVESNISIALVNPLRERGTLQQAEQRGRLRKEEEPVQLISQLLQTTKQNML